MLLSNACNTQPQLRKKRAEDEIGCAQYRHARAQQLHDAACGNAYMAEGLSGCTLPSSARHHTLRWLSADGRMTHSNPYSIATRFASLLICFRKLLRGTLDEGTVTTVVTASPKVGVRRTAV